MNYSTRPSTTSDSRIVLFCPFSHQPSPPPLQLHYDVGAFTPIINVLKRSKRIGILFI